MKYQRLRKSEYNIGDTFILFGDRVKVLNKSDDFYNPEYVLEFLDGSYIGQIHNYSEKDIQIHTEPSFENVMDDFELYYDWWENKNRF